MYKIALLGNPNVGKSTIFNSLTGLKQHTGNWPGKTVGNAYGYHKYKNNDFMIYDLPGTYSLIAHSKEEEIARDFVCFEEIDAIVVVCDAVCLERNLNLVLQTMEISPKVVVCVNLMDEANKKNIDIDLKLLSKMLNVKVVGTSARNNTGLDNLMEAVMMTIKKNNKPNLVVYNENIEEAISNIGTLLTDSKPSRFICLQLINENSNLLNKILEKYELKDDKILKEAINNSKINNSDIENTIVSEIVGKAEKIADDVITFNNTNYNTRNQKIDKFLTSKSTGILTMICLLMVIFWLTINGANYPSSLLFSLFSKLETVILNFLNFINLPNFIISPLVYGIYRVLTWVVAVMLPPMAIFFPLFTILEDLGYLPRIAFNLDKIFHKCQACGKQALTMCMGFGCNAVGVTGSRIIDSPRERLIAIITNNFVPCNGRFPTIIAIITMFFVGFQGGIKNSILSVLLLTGVILLGVLLTFLVSYVLSKTILKGIPSSFVLELPPYRKPKFVSVLVRSICDRTIFVLGRAVAIAAPAGLLIWVLANINIEGISILKHCANFLNPFANLIGLDGVILIAFILGFPANEIVIPIMIMIYLATGSLVEFENLNSLKELLVNNGWTWLTAICTILFSLIHFPCSTTCLTIKKETGSWKWTFVSILIPTVIGIVVCLLVATITRMFNII